MCKVDFYSKYCILAWIENSCEIIHVFWVLRIQANKWNVVEFYQEKIKKLLI